MRTGLTAGWGRRLLVLGLLGFLASACGIGGDGGFASVAYRIDFSTADLRIMEPAPDTVPRGREIFLRLEVPKPLDADFVRVRLEKRVGGAFFQRGEFDTPVIQPWTVAVIPVIFREAGYWDIGFIVNSRKVTNVEIAVGR